MLAHLIDPAVLAGLGMTTCGGLLHAAMLSLISDTTREPKQPPVRVRRVSSTSRNTHTASPRY